MSKKLRLKKIRNVLIAFFVFILIVGIGYLAWMALFQSKKADTSDSKSSTTRTQDVKIELTESTTDTIQGSGLAIKYPKSWKVTNDGDYDWYVKNNPAAELVAIDPKDKNPDNITITSPDDKVSVIFDNGNRPELDPCYADDSNLTLSKILVDSIAGYNDYVMATTVINEASGNGRYVIGVFKRGSWIDSVKVGDQYCVTGSQGIQFKTTDGNNAVLLVEIMLNDVKTNDATTLDSVNKAIESDNFNIAKHIVQSLYVKK